MRSCTATRTGGRSPAAHQSASVLVAFLEERAPRLATRAHAVAELACAIAERLDMPAEEIATIRHAAILHDIGKMAIPESALEKDGTLTPAEWELVRGHPLIGERILTAAPALERSARIARSRHERIDGQGCPDGPATRSRSARASSLSQTHSTR